MTGTPRWNSADLQLIASGYATVKRCSAPEDARIFLGNKILSDRDRIQSGHLRISGIPAIKWRIKFALKGQQLLGSRALFWSLAKTSERSEQLLLAMATARSEKAVVKIDTERYQRLQNSGEVWVNILEIARKLEALDATLILQGSHADGTTTDFSDIDLVLVGDPHNAQQQQLKSKLDRIILTADPLQHHGVFFYDRKLLDRYSESILPLDTFRRATTATGSVELNFLLLNDKYSPASTLLSFVKTLKRYLENEFTIRGMWDWKFKVSQFLLVPALLLATRELFIYKGDSFRIAAQLYSESAWQTIEELTRVRQQWKLPKEDSEASYGGNTQRHLGRLDHDPWQVAQPLAVWEKKSFLLNAKQFLDETLNLAGLA